MSNSIFDRLPEPSCGGIIFVIFMFLLPIIGFLILGPKGLIAGLLIFIVGLNFFFFSRKQRGYKCEICGREVINLGRGSKLTESMNVGTFISVSEIRAGREIFGDECLICGRVYCHNCAQYGMKCKCGSEKFRTVRLRYR